MNDDGDWKLADLDNANGTERPRIEVRGGHAEIWMGDRRVARMAQGDRCAITLIYQHMLEDRGEADAALYLIGVIHGLREAAAERIVETIVPPPGNG